MGATAKQIAAKFIGAAAQNPAARSEILRQAAYTFMGLAQDPKNVSATGELAKIGLEFAAAAVREHPVTTDDFTDLLHETSVAYEDSGNNAMDMIARRREVHDERGPEVPTPGHTSIAPKTFNKDATLGRSAKIAFLPAFSDVIPFPDQPSPRQALVLQGILQSQNVAFWQGTKKEAQAMTVDINLGFLPTLFVEQGGEFFTNQSARPYAEVEFGSDGNRTKVKFDVSFGNRCTVVGNYVAVTVGTDPPRLFNTGVLPLPETPILTAGASIGAFAAPSQAPLISTAYVDVLLAGATSDYIPIPLKAVQLLPLQSQGPLGSTATLTWFDYGGFPFAQSFYAQATNAALQPIPITGDAAFVKIENTGAAAYDFRLPFQLGL